MAKPTIWSSGPDPMSRTVCIKDEYSRRARYGRIQPMKRRRGLAALLLRLIPTAGRS